MVITVMARHHKHDGETVAQEKKTSPAIEGRFHHRADRKAADGGSLALSTPGQAALGQVAREVQVVSCRQDGRRDTAA